ncbi:M20 family metallopeptidase [Acidimicrobiia bacterium EGI L10123]|uniref:M20 metallopeptidase family protein n=1 Tax=Salinilacustrithrix flava TaxID=2957203 RepID=UPI003D7C2423|nr:M20 family metallopeptidase [Acidimicrobiia bacterium EGI L10123]
MTAAPTSDLLDAARAVQPDTVALRRDLHRHPEIGNDLPRTQGAVLDAIGDLGFDVRTGTSVTSVTATLDTGRPGGTMLLRGDMDALPMPEDTGLDYASEVDGAMHACGHDAHTAMLASAARLLADRSDDLTGKVVFMFQPGEEGHHGARHMLEEGLLDGINVTRAFAIHQSPSFPSGMVATKAGPLLASADEFVVEVVGRGGHAAMPHHANDPVPVACAMVGAFQTLVTRRVDVFDPAVVTVGSIRAGSTNNVIPETARLVGTIRAVSERTRSLVHAELERIATNIAAAHDMEVRFRIDAGFPVTVNDADAAAWVGDVARRIVDPDLVVEMPNPVMGAEDWSYVLQQVPGAMAFLGTCPPGQSWHTVAPNHSNRMVIDEDAMAVGVALYAATALDELAPR